MRRYVTMLAGGLSSLYLAMTVFSESTWEGPLFITLFLFLCGYGIVGLCLQSEKIRKVVSFVVRAFLEII